MYLPSFCKYQIILVDTFNSRKLDQAISQKLKDHITEDNNIQYRKLAKLRDNRQTVAYPWLVQECSFGEHHSAVETHVH